MEMRVSAAVRGRGKKRGIYGRLPARGGAKFLLGEERGSCLATITSNHIPGRTLSNVIKEICMHWVVFFQPVHNLDFPSPVGSSRPGNIPSLLHRRLGSDLQEASFKSFLFTRATSTYDQGLASGCSPVV